MFAKRNKDLIEVQFDYNEDTIKKIKTIEGRKWNPKDKVWTIPLYNIEELKTKFKDELQLSDELVNYKPPKTDSKIFDKEIANITDDRLKIFTMYMLDNIPDYFYHIAASSTGKYHPKFSLGEGGLVRHTKSALMFAEELFKNDTIQSFTDEEKDIIRVSLILHDSVKKGLDGSAFTTDTHPLDASKYINIVCDNEFVPNEVKEIFNSDICKTIKKCVEAHMGNYNKDRQGNEILPKPETELEKFVHLCDYLSSRKFINIDFKYN